ncbi:MAG: neutral zinc metallopeptidase, partial [Actinomycetota bacterium]|nr:neutral zinc metallopeptidase [Actinomycetota bacterium]
HSAPPAPAPAPKPPVPCLAQADDGLFATCLRSELDEVWAREFRDTGRTYTSPRLTVGNDPGPRGDHTRDGGPDLAFYSPRGGIHFPTQYLDTVHTAHGPRSHVVLSFTMSHETGHHVQFLLHPRIDVPVNDLEAQADCYAGMWARNEADAGRLDTEQFRSAAAAELNRLSTYPHEVATHGELGQRLASLDKGLHSADPAACDIGQLTWR